MVCVDRRVGRRIDDVLAQPVAGLHESVQVLARGVDGDPARVIAGIGGVDGANQLHRAVRVLAMRPQLVGGQVGRVEIRLGRVKDHAVDARVGLVGVILGVLCQCPRLADGKDVAIASVVVKGVGVDMVGRLARGEEEDGAGICGCVAGFGVAAYGVRGLVDDLCGRLDREAGPLFHGGAINVLFGVLFSSVRLEVILNGVDFAREVHTHVKGHP